MPDRRLVLLALVLGLGAGTLVAANPAPWLLALVAWIEPVGTLWINALRMVVVPLVVAMLVSGVASVVDVGVVRRLGGTSLATWGLLLVVSAALGLTLVPFLYSGLAIDPAATAALRASAASMAEATTQGLERMPGYAQWLVDLVPTNPVRAAADGAMLPLVVFSLALGLALTRVREERRDAVLRFFGGVSDAMLVIVGWVLALTPIGVFALSLAVAARIGATAAGAMGYYLVVSAVSLTVLAAALFAITVVAARIAPRTLGRAMFPALVVGFTSRSSLASLPAQVRGATAQLGLPRDTAGFVLPLATASFKPHTPLNWSGLVVFSALLYGVPVGAAELLTVVVAAVLLSFAIPGIPSAGMLLAAPVFVQIGIPVEALGILIAVDAIPDMFKTGVNVTGQFSSAVIVSRFAGRRRAAVEDTGALAPTRGADGVVVTTTS
ncbi:MAG TPA: dicarboxylate/amino acid:cation symporter [Gemmatimonadaceae bacterium]|nr:dicarboxylate/amino acid:cation symporter [Gemmatimonadaceae bacterium]